MIIPFHGWVCLGGYYPRRRAGNPSSTFRPVREFRSLPPPAQVEFPTGVGFRSQAGRADIKKLLSEPSKAITPAPTNPTR
jgi:hypothetical protein